MDAIGKNWEGGEIPPAVEILASPSALHAAFRQDRNLINHLLNNPEFLAALLDPRNSRPFRKLLEARVEGTRADTDIDVILDNVNSAGENAMPPACGGPVRKLRDWLSDQRRLHGFFSSHPQFMLTMVGNPAFVEQLKTHKLFLYTQLLKRAEVAFQGDSGLSQAIKKERKRLASFDCEGGFLSEEEVEIARKAKALLHAVRTEERDGIAELLRDPEARAFIDQPDSDGGITPLDAAASKGQAEIVATLLLQGANPNQAGVAGWTPLHKAAYCGHTHVAAALLRAGADPNRCTATGLTPLLAAASEGHTRIARMLLSNGADPNRTTPTGLTPLHAAAAGGHAPIVRQLLTSGAVADLATEYGWTPLHMAAYWGHPRIVESLIGVGADLHRVDQEGRTALDYAHSVGLGQSVLDRLEKAAAKPNDSREQRWTSRQRNSSMNNQERDR